MKNNILEGIESLSKKLDKISIILSYDNKRKFVKYLENTSEISTDAVRRVLEESEI